MHDVAIRDVAGFTIAGLAHRGSYAGIGATFGRMAALMQETGLGRHAREGVGVYHDSPAVVPAADLRAHAGCIVDADVPLPAPFERVAVPGGRTAVLTLRGPYDAIPGAWDYLYATWLPAQGEVPGDAAPYEVYLNDMGAVPPEALLTEIHVPLRG